MPVARSHIIAVGNDNVNYCESMIKTLLCIESMMHANLPSAQTTALADRYEAATEHVCQCECTLGICLVGPARIGFDSLAK